MASAAETFAQSMTGVNTTRPAPLTINGQIVATVLDNGDMRVYAVILTSEQAKTLRQWIKATYMDPI